MYFFETIAGLKGENLTTAVLKYLLTNSAAVRSCFLQSITGKLAPSQLPSFKNGIFCQTEVDMGDAGRIDLVVDADNVLIGIENKLFAEIQNGQPGKYADYLRTLASSKLQSKSILLIVLVPAERKREIDLKINAQNIPVPTIVICWQDLVRSLKTVNDDSSSNHLVAKFLFEYLDKLLGPLNIPKNCVLGEVEIGNQYQYDLLSKLQCLVNDTEGFSSRKLAPGKSFIGFGFDFEFRDRIYRNWLGFIREGLQSAFCVQAGEPNEIITIAETSRDSEIWSYGTVYKYKFDCWPETLADWRDFLQFTFEAIAQKVKSKNI